MISLETEKTIGRTTIDDLGLKIGNYLTEPAPSAVNTYTDGVSASALGAGEMMGNTVMQDGYLKSSNWVTGVSGWYLGPDTAELNVSTALLSLDIPDTTTANSFHVDSSGNAWWGATVIGSAVGKVLNTGAATFSNMTITGGSVSGTPISSIPNSTATDISLLEATHDLVFSVTDKDTVAWASGTITLSNGRTFSIDAGNTGNMAARTFIYLDTATSLTVLQTTTTVATAMGANKKLIAVAQNGLAQAQYTVYGGIGGLKLPATATSISNNNWNFSGTWSVTDADTVAWGAGTLTTSDGGSYSITGSNTGNMSAKTYIYFDLGTSATAFQVTTTAATAVGDGKILIAVAQNGTGEANYIVVNDKQLNIEAGSIVAGSITANEIATGTISADRMSVSQLSAIAADLGTITAGSININSGKAIITSAGAATFTDVEIDSHYVTVSPGENIQTAIDSLSGNGGIVALRAGTHTCNYDVVLPSKTYLVGETRASSIIDFDSNNKSVLIQGTGVYTTGTVSISNGGTTVTGSSTSWNGNITAGQYIMLGGIYYPITVVTDDTHLTIALPYADIDLSGAAYTVATKKYDTLVKDLTIKNSAGSALKIQYADYSFTENLEIQSSALAWEMDAVSNSTFNITNMNACNLMLNWDNVHFVTFYSGGGIDALTGNGFTLNNVSDSAFSSIFIVNCAGDGFNITSSSNCSFNAIVSVSNGGQGLELVSGNSNLVFNSGRFDSNASDGVKLTATSDHCFIQNSFIGNNGGYGVNIAASTCDENLIVGNIFSNNTTDELNNGGTGAIVRGNVGVVDNALNAFLSVATPSDNLKISQDTVRDENTATYTKHKQITIYYSGSGRIKFDLRHEQGTSTARGKIYINEVAIGTERTNATTTYETFSEDISFWAGARLQVYTLTDGATGTAQVKNFRIYFDFTSDTSYGSADL